MLLSILIPTRNRARALKHFLPSLVKQTAHRADIQIIVADNGSDNEAVTQMRDLAEAIPSVTFRFRDTNVGIIGNVLGLITEAAGEYIWLCGDDDSINCNLVERLIVHLTTNEPRVTRLKCEHVFAADLVDEFADAEHNQRGKSEWFSYRDLEQNLDRFEYKSGFITAHVFQAARLTAALSQIRSLPEWPQLQSNVYLTKLYTILACASDNGYWESDWLAVKQRVTSSAEANFRSSMNETYDVFFLSPARCYDAARHIVPQLAERLLSIHFCRHELWREFISMGKNPVDMIRDAIMFTPKLGPFVWLGILSACWPSARRAVSKVMPRSAIHRIRRFRS